MPGIGLAEKDQESWNELHRVEKGRLLWGRDKECEFAMLRGKSLQECRARREKRDMSWQQL